MRFNLYLDKKPSQKKNKVSLINYYLFNKIEVLKLIIN